MLFKERFVARCVFQAGSILRKGIADFIKQVKLEKAKLLLSATTMNIQEISDELAFGSRSYFSSSFQKAFGMSPSDYRNKNTKL